MTTHHRIDSRQRWLWGSCVAAFLIGIGLGWQHLGEAGPAPGGTLPIAASDLDHITLEHPFPARPDPAEEPGSLRFWLYPYDAMTGPPLADEVHPLVFELASPWVKTLLDKKLPNERHSFTFRMRGQISFSAPITHMHVRSDNGYRITFRDSTGHEGHMDDWEDAVTEDFYFQVTAEPGCYDIVIDFANVEGNAYFDLWSEAKDIRFFPAEATGDNVKSGP
jgi:hypothetical protein